MNNKDIDEKLLDSVCKNNIDKVKYFLENGADIDYNNGSPLYFSLKYNYCDMTKLLIYMGANVNIDNNNLLYIVCDIGNSEMVELLLCSGINFNGDTQQIIASCIINDDINSLKLLIQYDIIELIPDEKFYFYKINTLVNDEMKISIWNACIYIKAKNIMEFIINYYPEIIANDDTNVKKEDINKYNFIRILINRNLIDVPD